MGEPMAAIPMALPPAVEAASAATSARDSEVKAFTRRLAAAEDRAWTETHALYAPRLFRYLLVAAHGDEQAARDALQAAFVRAVRHARVFETEEAFWGWLTLLARHALADHRRAAGRWWRFLARFRDTTAAHAAAPPAPDAWPDHLDRAMAGLPDADRTLLEAKYFESASVRDLAAAAGVTEKAIESRLTRARARLRDLLLESVRP